MVSSDSCSKRLLNPSPLRSARPSETKKDYPRLRELRIACFRSMSAERHVLGFGPRKISVRDPVVNCDGDGRLTLTNLGRIMGQKLGANFRGKNSQISSHQIKTGPSFSASHRTTNFSSPSDSLRAGLVLVRGSIDPLAS